MRFPFFCVDTEHNVLYSTYTTPKEETNLMKKIEEAQTGGLLTEMEAKVMNYLLTDGFYAEKYFSDLDAKDIATATDIQMNVLRGVIGSLVKKDYLFIGDDNPDYDIIYATDKGYQLSDEYEERWEPDNIYL